jgi:hypothetical protein
MIGNCRVTVYEGRRYKSRRMGFIIPARANSLFRYDTWVAYDSLWNLLGVRKSRAEAQSLVLIRTGAWRG